MADNRPIGVFDSGVGGLAVVKELKKLMQNKSIVYFDDTGRVPYGSKSNERIIRYAREDEAFLLKNNVKIIVAEKVKEQFKKQDVFSNVRDLDRYFVSDRVESFSKLAKSLLGYDIDKTVKKINI